MRKGISSALGFFAADCSKSLRCLAHVVKLLSGLGLFCITTTISPFLRDRVAFAHSWPPVNSTWSISRSVCRPVSSGIPRGFTVGHSRANSPNSQAPFPYDSAGSPEVVVDTENMGIEARLDVLADYVARHLQITRTALSPA